MRLDAARPHLVPVWRARFGHGLYVEWTNFTPSSKAQWRDIPAPIFSLALVALGISRRRIFALDDLPDPLRTHRSLPLLTRPRGHCAHRLATHTGSVPPFDVSVSPNHR